ncbi:hypothetical protein [Pseudolysinimonas sp.]|uniref:hypothetical protein n=1 Tax=Pseudolysinimonas sp. TaxID=2680009 RepID=UPI003F7E1B8A
MKGPRGSVQPDIRGRVSLTKFLPETPGLYLVYTDAETGVIELRPINPPHPEGDDAA